MVRSAAAPAEGLTGVWCWAVPSFEVARLGFPEPEVMPAKRGIY